MREIGLGNKGIGLIGNLLVLAVYLLLFTCCWFLSGWQDPLTLEPCEYVMINKDVYRLCGILETVGRCLRPVL